MKIKLKDLDDKYGSTARIKKATRELPIDQLLAKTKFGLAFNLLGVFNFRKGTYKFSNVTSVEKACAEVLTRLGYYSKGKLKIYWQEKRLPVDDPIGNFLEWGAEFYSLPADHLEELTLRVQRDLKEILELIKWYEKDKVIIDYNNGVTRPQHENKKRIDFYKRCIEDRDRMIEHIATGVFKRAVEKAGHRNDSSISFILGWGEHYRDRPYRWWESRSKSFFDYREISNCLHRLDDVTVQDIARMEQWYAEGKKEAFYKLLAKYTPVADIFNMIPNFYMAMLPAVNERKTIFIELQKLFKAKKWYGFASLALIQVEGLFSDMLDVSSPNKSYRSLSDKVRAVRSLQDSHERYLDYYEFSLPAIRNQLLHSGNLRDVDFKMLSHDLLYDLWNLLRVFTQLKDSAVILHQIVKRNDTKNLSTAREFNKLFDLVSDVKIRLNNNSNHKQLRRTIEDWNTFQKESLCEDEIGNYAINLNEYLDNAIIESFETLRIVASYNGAKIDMLNMTTKEVAYQKQKIAVMIQRSTYEVRERFNDIAEVVHFLSRYKEFLPDCPPNVVAVFQDIQMRNKLSIAKMIILKDLLKKEQTPI